jgi:hypothetical protein
LGLSAGIGKTFRLKLRKECSYERQKTNDLKIEFDEL